jgi:hypothetical protein
MRLLAVLAAIGTVVLSACGDETAPDTTSVAGDQRYTATATVLESPSHGPQLCLGGVDESLPPQCGGPDITNWDWSEVESESASGTTWGTYTVVGTYDGSAFTLAEPAQPPSATPDTGKPSNLGTPCGEPDGGWAVVDEATATDEAMNAAIAYANEQSDFAGVWLDQSINEELAEASDDEIEGIANDPTRLVLNISFTGDIEEHKAQLREIWGGALCVVQADHTEAELRDIQQELHEEYDELLSSGVDPQAGRVTVSVIADDGSFQAELDDHYGEAVVVVTSALTPVE